MRELDVWTVAVLAKVNFSWFHKQPSSKEELVGTISWIHYIQFCQVSSGIKAAHMFIHVHTIKRSALKGIKGTPASLVWWEHENQG